MCVIVIWKKRETKIKIVNKIVTRERKEIGTEIEGVTGIEIEIEIDDVEAVAKKEIETRGEEEVEAGAINSYFLYLL